MTDAQKLADCVKRLAEQMETNFRLKLELATARKYLRAVRDRECWQCIIGISHEERFPDGTILDTCEYSPEKLSKEFFLRFPREP